MAAHPPPSAQDQPTTGPVALVAGASRGLGLLIAHDLLGRGHRVAICSRDGAQLDRARADLERAADGPGRVHPYVCDVADADAVTELVRSVEADVGPVDVLVSVAGVIQVAPLESLTLDHFRESVGVMLWGPVLLALAVLPGMRERGRGRIGTIASVGGLVSPPHLLPYATAKFGAVGFTEGLAAALAGTGVTATTVAPGLMRTGSHERATFAGDAATEFSWFAPAASLPLISKNAAVAAREIVDGILEGRPTVLVGWLPKVAVRVKGLAPGLVVRAMGVANRLLPGTGVAGRPDLAEGRDVRRDRPSRLRDAVTVLGSAAARRNLERPASPREDRD